MEMTEEELEREIKALERTRKMTFDTTIDKKLYYQIKSLKNHLKAIRESKTTPRRSFQTESGLNNVDYFILKKLFLRDGLGIDEIEEHFKGKYAHSQIRTAVIEVVRNGN